MRRGGRARLELGSHGLWLAAVLRRPPRAPLLPRARRAGGSGVAPTWRRPPSVRALASGTRRDH
eukprot:12956297-Alexandrium_andersonii.AAC.1